MSWKPWVKNRFFSFFFTLPRQAQKIKWTEAIFKNNYKTACFWVKTCICQAVAKNFNFLIFFSQALKLWQQSTLIEPTVLGESINMCVLLMWVLLFLSLSVLSYRKFIIIIQRKVCFPHLLFLFPEGKEGTYSASKNDL